MSPWIVRSLRWLAFLPAAVLAMFLAGALAKLITYLAWSMNPSRLELFFQDAFQAGLQGAAFVFVGAAVAPNRQRAVAFTFAVIAALLTLFAVGKAVDAAEWRNLALILVSGGAAVLTAITGKYEEFEYRPRETPLDERLLP